MVHNKPTAGELTFQSMTTYSNDSQSLTSSHHTVPAADNPTPQFHCPHVISKAATLLLMLAMSVTALGQTHYELTIADCAEGLSWYPHHYIENGGGGEGAYGCNYDYWIYYTAPEGCQLKVVLYDQSLTIYRDRGRWYYMPGGADLDYVYIKDGTAEPSAPYNQTWTRNDVTQDLEYTSSCNSIAIKFDNRSGYRTYLNYTVYVVGCDCEISESYNMTENTKTVTLACGVPYAFYDSGGSGGNYGKNENKVWTFTCEDEHAVVHIQFINFATYNANDYMIVYDNVDGGEPILRGYGGRGGSTPTGVQLTRDYPAPQGHNIVVKWMSDNDNNRSSGWYALVWADGCCNLDADIQIADP